MTDPVKTVQPFSNDDRMVSTTNGVQMTDDDFNDNDDFNDHAFDDGNDNDQFYDIPGIGQISYYGGVPEDVLMKLVDWVDGDSSLGDCTIGYDELEDTWTGTFTGGRSVMFDDESGFWYES